MKKLKEQAFINTIGNTVYLVSLWLLTVITTQFLGYESAGNLTLAMAVGNIVIIVQLFGVRGVQSSDIHFKYSPYLYLKTRLFTVCNGIILGISICLLLGYPHKIFISVLLFVFFKSFEAISDVFYGDEQRLGRLELAGYSLSLRGIITVLLFLVGAYFFENLNLSLLFIAVGGFVLTFFIDFPFYQRVTASNSDTNMSGRLNSVLKESFPVFFTTLIPAIITAVPRVLLDYWYGAELLGYYGNLTTPTLLLITLVPNILIAFLPRYGQMVYSRDYRGIMKLWFQSIIGTLVLIFICLLGVYLLGNSVLTFFYTNQILPYVHYLYFAFLAMGIYSIEICCAIVLIAMRESQVLTIAASLSLLVCLFISIPFIKGYGIGGAIAVLAIAYTVQVIIQAFCIIRMYFMHED